MDLMTLADFLIFSKTTENRLKPLRELIPLIPL